MKISFLRLYIILFAGIATLYSCKKNEDVVNGAANTAIDSMSNFSLTNRVLADFVKDSSSLSNYSGAYPSNYNKFRKLLTYDTFSTANKPVVYPVGSTVTVLAYMKGDDYALSKRSINVRFFTPPSSLITPISSSVINTMQKAEDSYRGFNPSSADVVATMSLPAITATNTSNFIVTKIDSKLNAYGVNVSTYLVQLNYTIPAAMTGKLISVNLSSNLATASSDNAGNTNWIYAFRVQ